MKLYADDPRDLSRSPTLEHFLRRYGQFIRNCAGSPETRRQAGHPHGRLQRPRGRICAAGLPHQAACLRRRAAQHCTDIIRFSHGASSSKKVYRSSFIPGLHDVCMIFEKAN